MNLEPTNHSPESTTHWVCNEMSIAGCCECNNHKCFESGKLPRSITGWTTKIYE